MDPLETTHPSGADTTWEGSTRDAMVVLLYLSRKYPEQCVVLCEALAQGGHLARNADIEAFLDWEAVAVQWRDQRLTTQYGSPAKFAAAVARCERPFVLTPFVMVSPDNRFMHANFLLFDRTRAVVERFEPYGTTPATYGIQDGKMEAALLELARAAFGGDPRTTDVTPLVRDRIEGLQLRQETAAAERARRRPSDPVGFCLAFSALYADFRAAYPAVPAVDVPSMILEAVRDRDTFVSDYIREYSLQVRRIDDELLSTGKWSVADVARRLDLKNAI